MNTLHITTHNPQETQKIGERLAKQCQGGEILCLSGNLGAGKTTFVKGIARGLGIDEKNVNSPTFVIMNVYEGRLPLYHFDFYRLESHKDIEGIGYDEFIYGRGVAVVEWAERFGRLMPSEHLSIELSDQGEQTRVLNFKATGQRYENLIGTLNG